jgi:hypothetical protein
MRSAPARRIIRGVPHLLPPQELPVIAILIVAAAGMLIPSAALSAADRRVR